MVDDRTETQAAFDVTQAAVDGLICELRKSVEKLKDSNRQLEAAIEAGDRDPELRAAIGVSHLITLIGICHAHRDDLELESPALSIAQRLTTRLASIAVKVSC